MILFELNGKVIEEFKDSSSSPRYGIKKSNSNEFILSYRSFEKAINAINQLDYWQNVWYNKGEDLYED